MGCSNCEELTREVLKLYRKKDELSTEVRTAWANHEQMQKIAESQKVQIKALFERTHELEKQLGVE